MEFYHQSIKSLANNYTVRDNNNKENKHVFGVSDKALEKAYHTTLDQINDEKNKFVEKRGIYQYISDKMAQKKFQANVQSYLNYFDNSTRNIINRRQYHALHDELVLEEARAKEIQAHQELLQKTVFIADEEMIKKLFPK